VIAAEWRHDRPDSTRPQEMSTMSLVSRRNDIMALVLATAVCALVPGYYHDAFWWPA
jgi:hypothetical protein